MEKKDKGITLMNSIFGNEIVHGIEKNLTQISPKFLNFLQETFADIYGDSTLDLRTKEIIVLSSLITQKDSAPQLKTHINAALLAGITQKEILALILHLVIYVGFPSTINALNAAQEVFNEKFK